MTNIGYYGDALERQEFLEMLKESGLFKNNSPDYTKIAKITGHSRDSVKSILAPGKALPRWLKLAVHVWRTQDILK